jgi:hypothetical protein
MYQERDAQCDLPYPCDGCNDAPGTHEVSGYGLTMMLCKRCYAEWQEENSDADAT